MGVGCTVTALLAVLPRVLPERYAATAIGGLSPDAFTSLFQAINGLRNRRALFAMLGCVVVGVLVAGLFSLLASRLGYFMAFLGFVAMWIASATGINAAGVLLMDQARGVPSRSLMDAVVYGLMCIPRFIALALLLFLVAVAVFVVLAIASAVMGAPKPAAKLAPKSATKLAPKIATREDQQ